MHSIGLILIKETERRILGESIPRLRKCLEQLTPEQIWFRPYPEIPSIGNLILHMVGNARQWLLHALIRQDDVRDRDLEFSEHGPLPTSNLLGLLNRLEKDLQTALPGLSETQLVECYSVQVFEESGVSILIHAIEHFSYHTGQVARETKRMLEVDLGFYADLDL